MLDYLTKFRVLGADAFNFVCFEQICTKRGPLGACLQTEFRTEQNDNDKANKYFSYTSKALRERNEVLQGSAEGESNALIERLKQQTEDNREKNKLDVERKTFENDQVRQ